VSPTLIAAALIGVDKGGPAPPPIAGQKRIFFVKIEGLSS